MKKFVSLLLVSAIMLTSLLLPGCGNAEEPETTPGTTVPETTPAATEPASQVLFPVKVGEKWGYLDAWGEWIIQPQFDRARDFNAYGYAAVQVNGKYGVIDTTGAWVIEPQYDDLVS